MQNSRLKKISVMVMSVLLLSGCSSSGSKRTRFKHKVVESNQIVKQEQTASLKSNKFGPSAAWVQKEIMHALASTQLKNSYKLNPNRSIDIDISEIGYTRFFIEGERITDVFVYPQESVAVQIHDQGYLVVVPQEIEADEELEDNAAENNQKVYITVTGEEGTTQDFSLRFTGKSPEPVRFVKSGNN